MKSDAWKIVLYLAATLAMAAALAPGIYNAGMALAEVTRDKETNGFLTWLGAKAWSSRDNFPRFFDRSLLFSALVLLVPLIAWLRAGRDGVKFRDTPWSLRLPDAVVSANGQPLRRNPEGWGHAVLGFAVAGGVLLVSGWVLVQAGFFMWKDAAASSQGVVNGLVREIEWLDAVRTGLTRGVIVGFIEEVLFRGLLLGIFLRAMKPVAAILSLSFIFALVHFLQPPAGVQVPDPEAWDAGFVLLGFIFERYLEPFSMIARWLVLFEVGVVLAWMRWRTASLWLPVGLHAGWVFAYSVFKEATHSVQGLPEWATWLVGGTLVEGLLPLVLVAITALVVALLTRPRHEDEVV